LQNTGIDSVWNIVEEYRQFTSENGFFDQKRRNQARYWMIESINNSLLNHFYRNPLINEELEIYEQMVLNDRMSSFVAARHLLDHYFEQQQPTK